MILVSANVNGIRAALRRGGVGWLAASGADVVALQEVRARDDQLRAALAGTALEAWDVAHSPSSAPGQAGVAVLSRHPVTAVRSGLREEFEGSGRWVEADLDVDGTAVTVASAYVHTGEAGTPRACAATVRRESTAAAGPPRPRDASASPGSRPCRPPGTAHGRRAWRWPSAR